MPMNPETWLDILATAFVLFEDARDQGFGDPPFSLGGGTVLMLRFKHRLSKDIDLFGYDAQWLSVLSPRLNAKAASLALDYVEQANAVKLVTARGDIDFIIAGDVTTMIERTAETFLGREVTIDPISEILAKKLFYRAATFKPRDVYDLSAAIDLAPTDAARAVQAAAAKTDLVLRRLAELAKLHPDTLLEGIIPYEDSLRHAPGMVEKVTTFIESQSHPEDALGHGSSPPGRQ